ALALGAALCEWPFLAAFIGLVAAAAIWNRVRGGEDRTMEAMLWPAVTGLAAGLAVVFVWNRSGLGSTIQVLPPDFQYRTRLTNEIAYVWPQITVPLAFVGWWICRNPRGAAERSVMRLFTLWLLATGAALATGFLGLHLPTYRALTFALPLALATAAAPWVATRLRSDSSQTRRSAAWVLAGLIAVVGLLPASALWYRDLDGRTSLEQISEFATVARIANRLPPNKPPVVVVNRRTERVYFYERLAATLLPPDRQDGIRVFEGTSADALAGRPTQGHGADRDALARKLFPSVAPALRSGSPILTGIGLDYPGYVQAVGRGATLIDGGQVAVLRGPVPGRDLKNEIDLVPVKNWWQVAIVGLVALVVLVLGGLGWSMAVLPTGPTAVQAMLAPAFGVVPLIVVGLLLSHAGVRPVGAGAWAAVAVTLAASAAAAITVRRPKLRRPLRSGSGERRRAAAATVALVALVAGVLTHASPSSSSAAGTRTPATLRRPNFVLILTDDQRWDSLPAMPNVERLLGGHGVTFSNSFVTTSVCCPSRAGLLTGRYSRDTGVYSDLPGAPVFDDSSTIATWLQNVGYTTAFVGKYLNNYHAIETHIPPGWNQWDAVATVPTSDYFDFALNENGRFVAYGGGPHDYTTTVLGRIANRFLETAKPPFFLHLATVAPHAPASPLPRDARTPVDPFTDWPPSFNEADVSDKPWASLHPPLTAAKIRTVDSLRERMLQSLQSVDREVGQIVRVLTRRGMLDNTFIVFTSDNGLLLGEHRLTVAKVWPYEESIRVPLVVRTPWARGGTVDPHLVLNIDIAPTLAQLAGAQPTRPVDGDSLVPLLQGRHPPWRTAFVEEFLGPDQRRINGGPPPFVAVRTVRYLYVVYQPGWEELYDLSTDPYEVHNLVGQPGSFGLQRRLEAVLRRLLATGQRAPPPRARPF
ncbi:MAG TPA: sulfatase, partial [Actinomycetota bacterium]